MGLWGQVFYPQLPLKFVVFRINPVTNKNMLTQVKSDLARYLSQEIPLEEAEILKLLESPKNSDHGQLAFPVFILAKKLRKAPPQIAADLSEQFNKSKPSHIQNIQAVGGFLNIKFEASYLQEQVEKGVLGADQVGFSQRVQG